MLCQIEKIWRVYLVRGTAESSSKNSEEYHADAIRGTNYLQFSNDGNKNKDNDNG